MMQNGYKICNKEFAASACAWAVFLLILVLPSAMQLKAEKLNQMFSRLIPLET